MPRLDGALTFLNRQPRGKLWLQDQTLLLNFIVDGTTAH